MSKISKEYIKEVKAMFPVKGKKERLYLKNLARDVEMLCEEENITSKENLYEKYGKPVEVVAEYFATVETDYVVKKLRISKHIKALVAIVITAILITTLIYSFKIYGEYKIAKSQEVVICEQVIEEITE